MSTRILLTSATQATLSYWILEYGSPTTNLRTTTIDSTNSIYTVAYQGSGDPYYAKINTSGIFQWAKIVGGTSHYIKYNNSNTNIYLNYINIAGEESIVQTDTSGVIQSQISFAYPKYPVSYDTDSSGNLYVTGYDTVGSNNPAAIKYNSAGVIQWIRYFTPGPTDAISVDGGCTDTAGNVYSVAINYSTSGFNYRHIVKYNTSGVVQWQRRLSSTTESFYNGDVCVDSSGNVFLASTVDNVADSTTKLHLAKYNSTGTLQWQVQYSDFGSNFVKCEVDSTGNIYVVGTDFNVGLTVILVKYNTSGTLQWQKGITHSNIGNSMSPKSINIDSTESIIIGLESGIPTIGTLVIKVPSDGSINGTFSSYTIANLSHTSSTATYTASTTTFTSNTGAIDTSSAGSQSLSNSSLTTTKIALT